MYFSSYKLLPWLKMNRKTDQVIIKVMLTIQTGKLWKEIPVFLN